MKKLIIRIGLGFLGLLILLAIGLGITYKHFNPSIPDSQAFINGQIITMDAQNSIQQAVLLKGNIIQAVGSNEEIRQLITQDTQVHDLNQQTMIPGIIDAHGHYPGQGISAIGLNLNSPPIGHVKSIQQALEAIKQKAQSLDIGQWIIGYGYDDTVFTENRHFSRAELDKIAPDHPVFLIHISAHMGVVNSAGLKLLNIDESTPNPEGGEYVKDSTTGQLNGLITETAFAPVRAEVTNFSLPTVLKISQTASNMYLQKGVTLAQNGLALKVHMPGLSLASRFGLTPLRVMAWPEEKYAHELFKDDSQLQNLQHDKFYVGAMKIVADGSLQLYSGFLTHPYHSTAPGKTSEYKGYPSIEGQKLTETVVKFHKKGYQLAIHGNGDAAIDNIINAVAAAQKAHPRKDPRHIVIHAQMLRDDQMDRMLKLGITPSFFSAHTYYWGDRHRDIFLGKDRAERISPTQTALDKGLRFSTHLDSPVVPMDPMLMVWATVNRLTSSGEPLGKEQGISVMQALRATTIDAAWQIFKEDTLGSIEEGKLADLVILEKNPLKHPATIKDIQVQKTFIDGVLVFDRSIQP